MSYPFLTSRLRQRGGCVLIKTFEIWGLVFNMPSSLKKRSKLMTSALFGLYSCNVFKKGLIFTKVLWILWRKRLPQFCTLNLLLSIITLLQMEERVSWNNTRNTYLWNVYTFHDSIFSQKVNNNSGCMKVIFSLSVDGLN